MGRAKQQNVTISLPADLLREIKHLAVDQGLSLSRFVALLVEQEVEKRQRYGAARDRQLFLLQAGLPLQTQGRVTWERSEIHEC